MAIIATIGLSTTNSYVTASEADKYFFAHPYSSLWAFQEAHLLYAAVLLDSLITWKGEKVTTVQRMQWPRQYVAEPEDSIPLDIKNAQCELLLHLLANTQVVQDNELDKIQVGPIKIDFNEKQPGDPDILPLIVKGFVSRWGTVNAPNKGVSTSKLIRA